MKSNNVANKYRISAYDMQSLKVKLPYDIGTVLNQKQA